MIDEKKDILDGSIQRFAISGLSKERKDEAVNEEVLMGKYTGEFFIKTKEGVVISTDILNRLKSSTDSAIRFAESAGMTGDIFRVDFDNLITPAHIDYSVNILATEPIELPNDSKKILLNIDFDEYDIINDTVKPVNTNAVVNVTISISKSTGETLEVQVNKSLQSINQSVIEINKDNQVDEILAITISNITVIKDNDIINPEYTDRTIILHNLFLSINK